jgi:uncharacterized protein YjbJ (UPF0337 family)
VDATSNKNVVFSGQEPSDRAVATRKSFRYSTPRASSTSGSSSKLLGCARAQTLKAGHPYSHPTGGAGAKSRRQVPPITTEHVMNKDQVKGRVKEAKGKVKEIAGRIVGDKTMENKGKLQNATGQAQSAYGDAKEDIKDTISSAKKDIKDAL